MAVITTIFILKMKLNKKVFSQLIIARIRYSYFVKYHKNF